MSLRIASRRPLHRTEPLEVVHLQKLASITDFQDLLQVRNLTKLVLSFSGFLRSSEVLALHNDDIKFDDSHITLSIERSKTDQLREGRNVIIAKSGSPLCPVVLLKQYVSMSLIHRDSREFLFRPISSSKNVKKLVTVNKPICYSTYREAFKKLFTNIVSDIASFSTHSSRSGGATAAANSGDVSDRNVQLHCRWKSTSSKDIYIKYSLDSRLNVSKSLQL